MSNPKCAIIYEKYEKICSSSRKEIVVWGNEWERDVMSLSHFFAVVADTGSI
jgi:hypothetical protein